MSTVLVTGGSGFVASHCILQLLAAGHAVRTTVRSRGREAEVRAMLAAGGVDAGERLAFAEADLNADAGWDVAVAGCAYVLHVASPLPPARPAHEDDLIIPARDGALRVLRAARDAGAKRVVLTSSFAAVGYGRPPGAAPFDETSWTDTRARGVSAYVKSKALAERAAWDFVAREGGGLELVAVNPTGVFGPVLGPDFSASIGIVQRMLDGRQPGWPKRSFGVVDVRDLADLHLRAMIHPRARGERFLAVAGEPMSMRDVALALRAGLGAHARRLPTRELPNWLVRLAARRSPELQAIVPELGKVRRATCDKARRVLGWSPRPAAEAIVATGESLVRFGLVR